MNGSKYNYRMSREGERGAMKQILTGIKNGIFLFWVVFAIGSMECHCVLAQDFSGESGQKAELVWAESDGTHYQIYYSHYQEGVWSEKDLLSHNDYTNTTPTVAVEDDGTVWAVWSAGTGSGSALYFTVLEGNQWTQPEKIETPFSSNTAPALIIGDSNLPWLVWAGFDGEDDDIYFSEWTGGEWAPPVMINQDNSVPDILPGIWKDADGTVRVSWSGFSEDGIRNAMATWDADDGWGAETEDSGAYSAFLGKMGTSLPDLPGFVKNPLLASICLQNPGEKETVRIHDLPTISRPKTGTAPSSSGPAQPDAGSDVIIAYGDSITQGIPYITYNGDGRRVGGYEPYLESLTLGIGWSTHVLNYGVGGETSMAGYSRLSGVLNMHAAKYVLIMEGTNDPLLGISPHSTIQFLGGMVTTSRQHQVIPIIATLTPDTKKDEGEKDIPGDYNMPIAQMAATRGVLLSDHYAAMIGNWSALTADGRHPNNAGYKVMAKTWFKSLPKTTAITLNATDGTTHSAVLNGRVNPQGVHTTAYFEYGVDANFGSETEHVDVGSGSVDVPLSVTVEDLDKDTTYFFRIVATTSFRTVKGQTLAFQTAKGHSSGGCFIQSLGF
ncbi:MAG: hypothetical protein DSY89_03005 [Deltaproteobacteria bacterium]|nr:MAG: hypothetical protein DSY89_03005 [Deltaproteobacteria bacterium]